MLKYLKVLAFYELLKSYEKNTFYVLLKTLKSFFFSHRKKFEKEIHW